MSANFPRPAGYTGGLWFFGCREIRVLGAEWLNEVLSGHRRALNILRSASYSGCMEEAVHPGTESGSGFEPVTVRQFTVFLENRVGRLTLLVRALEEGTRIVGISIEESADSAGAGDLFERGCGREILRSHGFSFGEVEVLIVSLPRRREPLMSICSVSAQRRDQYPQRVSASVLPRRCSGAGDLLR